MHKNIQKADLMRRLARNKKWGNSYDRLEYYNSKYPDFDEIIKELSKVDWILIHKKPKFIGLSLNTLYKREIIIFVENNMPKWKGYIS